MCIRRSGTFRAQEPVVQACAAAVVSGGRFAALQNLIVQPFSWTMRGTDSCNEETKKEIGVGLVSRERQLARLRERMVADGGVVLVSRLKQEAAHVPCRRCADRVVTP